MTTSGPAGLADPAGSYAKALDATRRFVAGMANVDWEAATPCSERDVRQLPNHLLYGTVWIDDIFAGKTVEDVGATIYKALGIDGKKIYMAGARPVALNKEGEPINELWS